MTTKATTRCMIAKLRDYIDKLEERIRLLEGAAKKNELFYGFVRVNVAIPGILMDNDDDPVGSRGESI